jgi:glucokinase
MNSNLPFPRLVGDVGGTNARFAWWPASGAPLERVATLRCAEFTTLGEAMRRYLADQGLPSPRECAIGIANPVAGDRIKMTNHHWSFSISELQQEMGFGRFVVVNDFTALALALPGLAPAQLRQVGGGAAIAGAPMALIGPGTGLGVSGLLPTHAGAWLPLSGEGGHVTLCGATPREDAVIAQLRQRFGHASAERAVSGQGLENLYGALQALDAMPDAPLSAADISQRALAGGDAQAAEALAIFCALLGSVAGNLALTLGAFGGVYIGGGIVPRLGDYFDRSDFRARFEAKGRFTALLASMPVFVIDASTSPALDGAARALDMA